MTEEERKARWNEFVEKLNALIDEYNVALDYGCGCCSNGHYIEGKEVPYGDGWRTDA